jgi:hypothetical protein
MWYAPYYFQIPLDIEIFHSYFSRFSYRDPRSPSQQLSSRYDAVKYRERHEGAPLLFYAVCTILPRYMHWVVTATSKSPLTTRSHDTALLNISIYFVISQCNIHSVRYWFSCCLQSSPMPIAEVLNLGTYWGGVVCVQRCKQNSTSFWTLSLWSHSCELSISIGMVVILLRLYCIPCSVDTASLISYDTSK